MEIIKKSNRFCFCLFFCLIFGLSFSNAKASEAGYADTLLVVNDNSITSIAIGEYFLQARPTFYSSNVVHISATTSEWADRTEYTNNIKTPIENFIQSHNLSSTTNYIILTKGVPIGITDHFFSVDSELAWCLGKVSCAGAAEKSGGYGLDNPFYNSNTIFSHSIYNMYIVTRLDGYAPGGDISQIKNMIDHSAPENIPNEAVLKSEALFVLDGDAPHGVLNMWNRQLESANTLLTSRGWNTILDETTTYLRNKQNVLGYWSLGSNSSYIGASGQGSAPGNTYENGAIGETAVSTSARSFDSPASYGQSLIADWISEGISAMKGYASEPYTMAVAKPDILFDHYTSGYNMADSYYAASVDLFWKDIVIGDPKMMITSPSSSTQIVSFTFFEHPLASAIIDSNNYVINVSVPYGTDITNITPIISVSAGASISPASGVAANFTNPVTYTVTAQDGTTTQNYIVTITVAPNPSKTISTFNFNGLSPVVTGFIDEGKHEVTLVVPDGIDITTLAPSISITGISISPASGIAENFTNPVTYTVTAADNTTQDYVVKVVPKVLASTINIESGASNVWSNLGSVGSIAYYPDFKPMSSAIYDGILYVAFSDINNGDRATVMKYDGASWTTMGNAGFSGSVAYNISLYIYNGIPYVAYLGGVMKYEGGSWVNIGDLGGVLSEETQYISISVYNGTPYLVYTDSSRGNQATLIRFDGTNWVTVGDAGFSKGAAAYPTLYIYNNIPYVAYYGGAFGGKIIVMKYDGTNWVTVGGTDLSEDNSQATWRRQMSLTVYGGTPILAYSDNSSIYKLKVIKYDGTRWINVGDTSLYFPIYEPSIYSFNGVLYVSYYKTTDGLSDIPYLLKFDGTNWVDVSGTFLSGTTPYITSLFLNVDNNTPYITFKSCPGDVCEIMVMKAISTISNGDTLQMSAIFSPSNTTDKSVTWSVLPGSGTATVNPSTGLLTATGVGDVTITATANDGSSASSSQKINILTGTSAKITSFSFLNPPAISTIDNINHTISISVPYGTDVTNLTPTIVTSLGASASTSSGVVRDFSNPVTYTITAQDGVTQQNYIVTVTISPQVFSGGGGGGGGSLYIPPVLSTPLATTTSTSTIALTVSTSTATDTKIEKNTQTELNKLIDLLISLGIISPTNANKARNVIISLPVENKYLFSKDLYLGVTDVDVVRLQEFLNLHNFTVSNSGPGSSGKESKYFGIKTQASLMNFQRVNNISPISGYFGPKTRMLINSMLSK